MSEAVAIKSIIEADYPFSRTTHIVHEEGASNEILCWRPGCRIEEIPVYEDACDHEYVSDGVGKQILEIISTHKPGKYPERTFFIRTWEDPEGKRFGKTKLRILSTPAFKRLAAGYRYKFRPASRDYEGDIPF